MVLQVVASVGKVMTHLGLTRKARLISNLDPWGTRGILRFDTSYILNNTVSFNIFLINNILIAYAW